MFGVLFCEIEVFYDEMRWAMSTTKRDETMDHLSEKKQSLKVCSEILSSPCLKSFLIDNL